MQYPKAVFPVAGLGTRFLLHYQGYAKELLPIVDKPLIQYAATAISAGIDRLIFVTGRNGKIQYHFHIKDLTGDGFEGFREYSKADMVKNIMPEGVECIFVRQPEQPGLGHAGFVEACVGDEPFEIATI